MNVQLIELFIEAAKVGSFAEVARRRDIDPSQVSRAIAQLESRLNASLFQRSTRSLTLTETGERYLKRVLPLLEELQAAEDDARTQAANPSGLLRITSSTAFGQVCLLPLLPEFYQRYPDIQLELLMSDSVVDLVKDNIDIACRLSAQFDSGLRGYKLFDTRYHIVASPEYVRRNTAITMPSDLANHDCIVFSLAAYRSQWLLLHKHEKHTIKIRSRLAVSNALALRGLLLQGLGPGLVPSWLVEDDIASAALVPLLPEWQVTATDFSTAAWLLYPSAKYLPLKSRVMLDYLKEKLSAHLHTGAGLSDDDNP